MQNTRILVLATILTLATLTQGCAFDKSHTAVDRPSVDSALATSLADKDRLPLEVVKVHSATREEQLALIDISDGGALAYYTQDPVGRIVSFGLITPGGNEDFQLTWTKAGILESKAIIERDSQSKIISADYTQFYENGIPRRRISYDASRSAHPFVQWRRDGTPLRTGQYHILDWQFQHPTIDGHLHGIVIEWGLTGQIARISRYELGRIVSVLPLP